MYLILKMICVKILFEVVLWHYYLAKMNFAYIKNREIVFWKAYNLIYKGTAQTASILMLKKAL